MRTLLAALLLAGAAVGLTACSSRPCPTTPVPGIAIAVGDRANSPTPRLPDELRTPLAALIDSIQGQESAKGVTLVRVDGRPSIGCSLGFDTHLNNDIARSSAKTHAFDTVATAAAALPAVVGEADDLAALSTAAAAAGPGGTVVLLDSGLSTVAPLNFAADSSLLSAAPTDIATQLAAAGALPDLSGRAVILAGIGYTAAPQPPLDPAHIAHLVEIWQAIATRAGATSVVASAAPNTGTAPSSVPAVTVVPVPPVENIQVGCNTTSVFTNDSSVGFVADSTTFSSPARASSSLAQFASWLVANPSASAVVTGNIAHYGDDDGLALARAQAVRTVLLAGGAAAGAVTAVGDGWGPLPSRDAPPDPAYDDLNRRVTISLTCP